MLDEKTRELERVEGQSAGAEAEDYSLRSMCGMHVRVKLRSEPKMIRLRFEARWGRALVPIWPWTMTE